MSIEAHREEAGRIVEREGGLQSHLQALALAKRWCAEALSARAELEAWKQRAEGAEVLLENLDESAAAELREVLETIRARPVDDAEVQAKLEAKLIRIVNGEGL